MKLRVFVLSAQGNRAVAGAPVSLVLTVAKAQRFELATAFTDRQGYARLELRQNDKGQRLLAALAAAGEQAANQAVALALEVPGNPECTRLLFEREPRDPQLAPNAAVASSPWNALGLLLDADTPVVLRADKPVARGPEGRVSEPDATDYALSPQSFLMQPLVRTGDGSCEHLMPASLPLREYTLHEVAVLTPARGREPVTALPSVGAEPAQDTHILWGQLLEFRQTWRSLGHSLGEIKYSLTLAPGEAVKVAVIDWKRSDQARREGSNSSSEGLTHEQTAERDIDDIVSGRVEEMQRGASIMGGLAGAMDFTIPQYGISAAGRHSIGAGMAYTEGTREVAASAHENIHQQVMQRSNLARTQNSTVVVQATQAESDQLATRIVANMNRGHALSILYYEILRHLAVRTEYVRADPCVLVPVSPIGFDRGLARRYRAQLEPALLDRRHAAGFDAIERIAAGAGQTGAAPSATAPAPAAPDAPSPVATRFVVTFSTEWRRNYLLNEFVAPADTAGAIRVLAELADGTQVPLVSLDSRPPVLEQFTNISQFPAQWPGWNVSLEARSGANGPAGRIVASFVNTAATLDLRQLRRIVLRWRRVGPNIPGAELDGWNLRALKVTARTVDREHVLVDHTYALANGQHELFPPTASDQFIENTSAPLRTPDLGAPAPAPGPSPAPAPATAAVPDEVLATALVNHLNDNRFHYGAQVWLNMDPRERRMRLMPYAGHVMARAGDQPLAMSGNHLAFRYHGELPEELRAAAEVGTPPAPRESIASLPTRGVFAEAHLGQCNAAEERDITRYWAFDELPVSLLPNIDALKGGARGSMPTITPDSLGQGVLGVQNWPGFPGVGEAVAKALELMGKSDIFRDMSARQEVAQVMAKLIEAAKPPALSGAGVGAAWGGASPAPSAAPAAPAAPAAGKPDAPASGVSLDPGRYAGSLAPTQAFDQGVVTDRLLDKLDLPQPEKDEIKADHLRQNLAAPAAPPAPRTVDVLLSARVADSVGATRALNGTVTLYFFGPGHANQTAGPVASAVLQVERGVAVGRSVQLPPASYSVRAHYEPMYAESDLAFLNEPQFASTGVNLRGLVSLVHDLMQRDLGSEFAELIRGDNVVVQGKTRRLQVELSVDLAPDGQHKFSATLGSNAGVTVDANRKIGFDSDGLAKTAAGIAGALKGAGAAATALLSLVRLQSNLDMGGKLSSSADTELRLEFTPRYVRDAFIKVTPST